MALEILLHDNDNIGHVVHEAKHDVESFIWVLSYSVMRKLCQTSKQSASREIQDQYSELRTRFRTAFSQVTSGAIASQRWSRCDALRFPVGRKVKDIIEEFMSPALVHLFEELQVLVHISTAPQPASSLTHDDLLNTVNKAITSLQL